MVVNVNDCNFSDVVFVLDEYVIVKFICDCLVYVIGVYKILDSLRIFLWGKFLLEIFILYFGILYFRWLGFFDLFIIYVYDMLLC